MGVPSFSGRGGGGGQDRARGRHLTAAYTLSTFGRFNQWGGGGGGGGGGVLSAFDRFNQWGGCCPLSADSTSGGVLSAFGRFIWEVIAAKIHAPYSMIGGGGGGGGL